MVFEEQLEIVRNEVKLLVVQFCVGIANFQEQNDDKEMENTK